MNEKKVKQMRKHARHVMVKYDMDKALFRLVYRSIKKGVRNEAKLARFRATSNQLVERTNTIHKESSHDPHDE